MSFLFGSDSPPLPPVSAPPSEVPKPKDAELRAQEEGRRASGADIMRGDSEVDALGSTRRRNASRAILG